MPPLTSRSSSVSTMTASSTLVVGLDIGTTFSGASWAQHEDGPSQHEPMIHVIDSWPYRSGVAKVPTQIAFDTDTFQSSTKVLWGYGIEALKDRASWLKLLLLDDGDLPEHVETSAYLRDAKQFLTNTDAGSGVDLMSQYLKVLWNHVIRSITQVLGPDIVKTSHLKVVMTIPAIWPPYAVDRMCTAAKDAGITSQNNSSLTFMTEPEAAALCNFYGDRRFMQQKLAADDTFVVCDAGGGTVDLITYRVVQCSDSVLALEEVMPGKGGLCGAAFLDEAFEELLLEHFGGGWKSAKVYERKGVMEDAWERRIKPDFDGDDTMTHLNVLVPSSCQYYTRTSDRQRKLSDTLCASYEFTRDEIASVFDPIVREITQLILEQISGVLLRTSKKPKYIIMSGGFGQSKYLVQKVKAMLAIKSSNSILLGMNSSSWSAVSRGAVLQGLAGYLRPSQAVHVRSRVSRASYCTLQYETWDDSIHDQRDKRWSDEEGGYVADDQTVWFLKYGDLINEGYSKRFEFYSMHLVSKGIPSSHTVSFFHCRDTEVPERLGDTVKELCSIEWSDKSQSAPEIFENGLGDDFYAVCFDVEMVVRGAGLEFSVLVGDKKVAEKNVKVQYTAPDSHPKTLRGLSGLTSGMASCGLSRRKTPKTPTRPDPGPSQPQPLPVKPAMASSTKRKQPQATKSARKKFKKNLERLRSGSYEEGPPGSWGSWGR